MLTSKKIQITLEYMFFIALMTLAPITVVLFSQQRVNASPASIDVEAAGEVVLPIISSISETPLSVTAQHALAIDVETGGILFEKNAHQVTPPASLTKLATALTAVKLYTSDHVFTVNDEWQAEGNRVKLLANEQLNRDDLLKALLIFSGNDAAEVLANHHPDGRAAFIETMNAEIKAAGAFNTIFQNPTGLDDFDHVSTAYDLGLLFRQVILQPKLLEIIKIPQTTIASVDGKFQHTLYTTNSLLGKRPEMIGGKTGSTDLAGQCLIALVEIEGHQVITVILNSQERFADTTELIDWLTAKYDWETVKYTAEKSQ